MNYNEYRNLAIKWLKGKHDFNKGIEIMRKAGFKPVVVKVLARQGENAPCADQRLTYLMRDLIKAWAKTANNEDTSVDLGVENGQELGSGQIPEKVPNTIFEAAERVQDFPESIGQIITQYRDSYLKRDKLMKELAEVGEENDMESIEKRKELSDAIKAESDIQDKLYPKYARFLDSGELPSDDEEESDEPVRRVNIEKEAGDLNEMSKEELQRLRKSLATKVIRAKNMLLYQQETAAEVENPIPEDDARFVKYTSKVARLAERIDEIDIAIAKLA